MNGAPVGSTFSDMFGEWTVTGAPAWVESAGIYVQTVRDPDGYTSDHAVDALVQYLTTDSDRLNNGLTVCHCGCKYWLQGRCFDCGAQLLMSTEGEPYTRPN